MANFFYGKLVYILLFFPLFFPLPPPFFCLFCCLFCVYFLRCFLPAFFVSSALLLCHIFSFFPCGFASKTNLVECHCIQVCLLTLGAEFGFDKRLTTLRPVQLGWIKSSPCDCVAWSGGSANDLHHACVGWLADAGVDYTGAHYQELEAHRPQGSVRRD